MKRKCLRSMITLMLWLSLAGYVFAGESVTLQFSCTIPAIPGVNAPLIEEENVQTNAESPQEPEAIPEEQTQPESESPKMIQEDSQTQYRTSDNQESLVVVRTLYSR